MQRSILPSIILLSVCAGLVSLWSGRRVETRHVVSSTINEVNGADADGAPGPRWALRVGERATLDVDYRAETTTSPLGAQAHGATGGTGATVSGAASVRGAVALETVARRAGGARVLVQLVHCEAASVRVLDRDLLAGAPDCARALEGELLVDVNAQGEVQGMGAASGTPTLGTRVLEALALELFVPLPRAVDDEEDARDTTPRGAHAIRTRATQTAEGFDVAWRADAPLEDARLPAEDAHVSAAGTLALARGRLVSLQLEETVRGAGLEARTRLQVSSAGTQATTPRPELLALPLGPAFRTSEDAQARALAEQRIAGLTAPEVMSAASVVSAGGEIPGGSRFLWRATALVGQDPALARALGEAASDAAVSTRGRGFCLDLLAQAGSADAERALLAALASDAAQADRYHAVHVQRLSLLEHPSRASTDAALAAIRSEARPAIRGAWLASAGSLSAAVDDDGARAQLHDALRTALRASAKAGGEELQAALLGVGNSASPALAEDAVPFLRSEEAAVRAVAVQAVADARHPLAAQHLATAAHDGASLVQRVALRALDQRFTAAGVAAVASAVDNGALRHDNVRVALDLLKHHGHEQPAEAQAALESIMQDDAIGAEERAAARSLANALTHGAWGG